MFGFWLGLLLQSAPGRDYYLRSTDHGFQLALGQQVLFGKIPGVDVFNHYGPLVMYVSALGQWLSGSLVGEAVVCAVGYAASLMLLYVLVGRGAGWMPGLVASLAGYFLLARFYKWYVWLLPLVVALALARCLEARDAGRTRAGMLLGFTLGLTALFRPDMGATCGLAAVAALLLVAALGSEPGRWGVALRVLLPAGIAVSVTFGSWLLFLLGSAGIDGVVYFFRSTLVGGIMMSDRMGTPLPSLDLMHPFAPESLRAISYLVIFSSYAAGLWIGLRAEAAARATPDSRLLLAATAAGLAIVHQGLHRNDGHHLLQIAAPAIVCVVLLLVRMVRMVREMPPDSSTWLLRSGLGVYCAALALLAVGLPGWGRADLASLRWEAGARYRTLAEPLEVLESDHTLLATAREILTLTDADDAILVYLRKPQLYALTRRRMSGKIYLYHRAVFASQPWRGDNLSAVEADPPKLAIVPAGFLDARATAGRRRGWKHGHPEVRAYLQKHYRNILYESDSMMILGPRS